MILSKAGSSSTHNVSTQYSVQYSISCQLHVATFGVDFSVHLCATHCSIPHVVVKCVNYIEEHGMQTKGIYRVAGAKSKMQSLCRSFENGLNLVDLTEKSPHLVSSVLKLYLRQLPEPLLMHSNYAELIEVALRHQESPDKKVEHLQDIRKVLLLLPKANRYTLRFIVEHLNRVSKNEAQNQMSSMNLGIVFGPTLVKPMHEHSSASIVHINHHSIITQLMIDHPEMFMVEEEETEYSQLCINPKVTSMSDVLPISTRTSIKLLASSDHYFEYVRKRKSSRMSIKTHSEPNVLEPTCSTRLAQNQMSSMNLGIVFGPTLVKPMHEHSSASIVHINHHSIITQLMIDHPEMFMVEEEETEYSQLCINPKVTSMSDVLPISTRTSIKLLASSDHYFEYVRKRKSSRMSIKTHSEPNVLEPTCSTRLVPPPFPGEGSQYVNEDDTHTRIIRAFSEPSKCNSSFGSQEFLSTRSDLSNISSELSSTDNLLDSTDETSFFDTDEDETCLQEYVAQQLKGIPARLQILRKCSLSTSDSDDGAMLNVKYVQSSQSEVSSDPFVPACRARLVNLGINNSINSLPLIVSAMSRSIRLETRSRARDELKRAMNSIDKVRKWEKKWVKVGGAGCKLTVYKWSRKAVQIADKTDKDKPADYTLTSLPLVSAMSRSIRLETRSRARDELKRAMNSIDKVRKWEKKWVKVGGAGCKLTVYKWSRKAVQIADKTDKDKPAVIAGNGSTIKSTPRRGLGYVCLVLFPLVKKSVMLDSNSNTFVSCVPTL
eukprot:sb/3462295/